MTVRVPDPAPVKLDVTSDALTEGGTLAQAQVLGNRGGGGGNVSPDLAWGAGPQGTACYAVTCYDPDAPTGSGFWHWTLVNIPASVTALKAGEVPAGAVAARNDYGFSGYGGACPPVGDGPHRYVFTVYALKEPLAINEGTPSATAGFNIHAGKLAEGSITVTYAR